jgi:CDP-paratose synthetase
MNIVVTGGTGFIGSYLVRDLLELNHQLLVLTRQSSLIGSVAPNLSYVDSTLRDFGECFNGSVDMVIHLASEFGRGRITRKSVFESNFSFPKDVLEKALDAGCKYFLNTDSYYTLSPREFMYLNNYIESKIAFRDYVESIRNLKSVNMRLFHVYGELDAPSKFIPWITREIINSEHSVKLDSPCSQILDFVHVTDVSKAYIAVVNNIRSLARYTEFDVGTGSGMALKSVCEIIHSTVQGCQKKHLPELIFGVEAKLASTFPIRFIASKKLTENIGWTPDIDIVQGITRYVKNEL